MPSITVGCRLPNGLMIYDPRTRKHGLKIRGLNESNIIGAPYVTTQIDAELWNLWKDSHRGYKPLESGAIFEVGKEIDAESAYRQFEKELTGFEPLSRNEVGTTAEAR